MSESIQAPKRKYTRKPKVVESVTPLTTGVLGESPNSDSDVSTTSTDSDLSLTPPEQVPQKPKRQYKKKVVISEPVDVDPIPPPPVLERQTNTPPSSPEPVKEKKPRTEKQIAAFNKMREQRLKKTDELKKLKEVEREQKMLEKEQNKLNTITEKIVEKAASIKQRKSRKLSAEKFDVLPEPQYQHIIQETKPKPILFV